MILASTVYSFWNFILLSVLLTLVLLLSAVAFVLWRKTKQEIHQVHVLVNGRLSQAMQEIEDLRAYIDGGAKPKTSGEAVPPVKPLVVVENMTVKADQVEVVEKPDPPPPPRAHQL